jgi:hypothetical protein
MATTKKAVKRPAGLSASDRKELARILKKAREFKAYYRANPTVKKPRG